MRSKIPKQALVVRDTQKDPRFVDNGLVKGFPFIRFYAGIPLEIEIDGCNWALGTLCVIDVVPRGVVENRGKDAKHAGKHRYKLFVAIWQVARQSGAGGRKRTRR